MILRRLGNKSKIAMDIQKYFPPHKIYIEPFFGEHTHPDLQVIRGLK